MRGVLLRGHGGLNQLDYHDNLPVPTPGPGEVLIEIGAAAVNNTDINLRTGWYSKSSDTAHDAGWSGTAVTFPRIQGADACGRIAGVGRGVDAARIGERVLVNPVFASDEKPGTAVRYFGSDTDGAFAQFAAVPAANAYQINSALSDIELASFPCSYSAAENLLTRAAVEAGDEGARALGVDWNLAGVVEVPADEGDLPKRLLGQDAELEGELGEEYRGVHVAEVVGGVDGGFVLVELLAVDDFDAGETDEEQRAGPKVGDEVLLAPIHQRRDWPVVQVIEAAADQRKSMVSHIFDWRREIQPAIKPWFDRVLVGRGHIGEMGGHQGARVSGDDLLREEVFWHRAGPERLHTPHEEHASGERGADPQPRPGPHTGAGVGPAGTAHGGANALR